MTVCAIPGCNSDTDVDTNLTFYSVPTALIPRVRWTIAAGKLPAGAFVCGRHFEARMFARRGGSETKQLCAEAVPTLFLEPPKLHFAPRPHLLKRSHKAIPRARESEVLACRACLAVDARLYAISGSGLEDAFEALTGEALSDGFPCHLCALCRAALAKCAAFRDRCRRSSALLHELLERGPLKLDDIKAIDRSSHKLANLSCTKVFQFGSGPHLEIMPLIKIENGLISQNNTDNDYTDVEYLESDDCIENNPNIDKDFERNKLQRKPQINKKVEIENKNLSEPECILKVDDYLLTDVEMNDMSASDSDTNIPSKKVKMVKRNNRFMPDTDIPTFERNYNVKLKLLSKEEQKEEIEERKRNNKSKFCCDLCGTGFLRENTIINHMWYHSPSRGPHECDVCRRRFRKRHKLHKHARQHREAYACGLCGHESRIKANAKTHYQFHEGSSYTCPYCDEAYGRKVSCYNHVRTAHPDRNVACDECGETFVSPHGVRAHKKMRHMRETTDKPKTDFKCTLCGVKFLSAEALQKHTELGAGEPHAALWPCAACGENCRSEAALATHTGLIHPPEHRHCDECDTTFLSAASFDVHTARKHVRRPTAVPFRRVQSGPRRARGGRGPTELVCEMCGKVFKNGTRLKYHRNTHLGVKPYACPECPKTFASRIQRGIHQRSHTGERPFECEVCSRRFATKENMIRHVDNVHLQIQTPCSVCGKSMRPASLWHHMRYVHLKIKPPPRKRDRKTERKRATIAELY